MPLSRIIFFTFVLFGLRTAVGAALVLVLGVQITDTHVVGGHIAGLVISALVFACMSYCYPKRAFLYALTIGALAYILGVLATTLVVGKFLWNPELLVFDSIEFAIAILVGVGLGTRISRLTKTAS